MKILDDIRKLSSLNEVEEYLKNLFVKNNCTRYIPAIVNEGLFTADSGVDFYLKLILAHHKVKLEKTWLKDNLIFGIYDPDFDGGNSYYDIFVENVITLRKVKGNNLYQINPNITSDSVEEHEYDNNVLVNAYFNSEYSKGKGIPVLTTNDNKNLLVIKDVLFPFLNEISSNNYPKYKLVAEYEYRTHDKQFIGLSSGICHTNAGVHDVYIGEDSIQIKGSIDINLTKENSNQKPRGVHIIDLLTSNVKEHNPRNFNDDLDAGFIIFSKEIINLLKDKYYFYDLMMFDKTDIQNRYLIDILSDKVVFWEGEYNKLPEETKDSIDKYNFVPYKIQNMISPGMKAWQLDADWNYDKKLFPEQLLAWKVRESYFNNAIEIGINFLIPNSICEFKEFIEKLEKTINTNLDNFDNRQKDVNTLLRIRNGEDLFLENDELTQLFRKYCYQICRVISND